MSRCKTLFTSTRSSSGSWYDPYWTLYNVTLWSQMCRPKSKLTQPKLGSSSRSRTSYTIMIKIFTYSLWLRGRLNDCKEQSALHQIEIWQLKFTSPRTLDGPLKFIQNPMKTNYYAIRLKLAFRLNGIARFSNRCRYHEYTPKLIIFLKL